MSNKFESLKDFFGLGFTGYLDRVSKRADITGITLSAMVQMGSFRELSLQWEAHNESGKRIKYTEIITKWLEWEEGAFSESLPPGYSGRFLLTIDKKMSDVKSKLPAVPIDLRMGEEDGSPMTQASFRQHVVDAQQKNLLPF